MKSKKFASLTLATALSMVMLTGCESTKTNANRTLLTVSISAPGSTEQEVVAETTGYDSTLVEEVTMGEANHLEHYNEKPETRIYEPYTHLFFKRYPETERFVENLAGGSVQIPEGYKVYSIQNYNEHFYDGSQTGGVDIWFINTLTVEVEPVFNKPLYYNDSGYYDYSRAGTVLDKEEEMKLELTAK